MSKEKEKSPAFQFYPKDYLSDTRVMVMSLAEQGAYCRALFVCWIEGGTITANPKQLCKVLGRGCTMAIAEVVIGMFAVSEDGKTMRHKRLDRERDKQQENSTKQAKIAEARWEKYYRENPDKKPFQKDATDMPRHMPEPSQKDALHLHYSIAFPINTLSREPKDFLKEKNEPELLAIQRMVIASEWDRCLDDWNSSVIAGLGQPNEWMWTGDDAVDLRALVYKLKKWCSSWNYNLANSYCTFRHM